MMCLYIWNLLTIKSDVYAAWHVAPYVYLITNPQRLKHLRNVLSDILTYVSLPLKLLLLRKSLSMGSFCETLGRINMIGDINVRHLILLLS